ncbi:MAG: YeeE/YedE family protein [Saprospiraceae bacterium]
MLESLYQPWPWYVAGVIIGLTIPALLILGNKHFGISSSFRHICAACMPARIPFFDYDWKKERWNLFFALGIVIGGAMATIFLASPEPIQVAPALAEDLSRFGISDYSRIVPADLFAWDQLLSLRGFVLMIVGGFLVGFGARYAGGCTSGHAIMGLSTLQWPSLVAVVSFMLGGFLMSNFLLPIILSF